jgi:ribosomal protein S18 acetylase RimI-like enzyme
MNVPFSLEMLTGYEFAKGRATVAWTIRRATPADVPVVVEFNRLLALESEGKTLDVGLLAAGVRAGLADPAKALYFVAEEAGAIVGQVMVTYEWSDWRNGWMWWLQSVYVPKSHRRRGVFRSLFEHVLQAARADPGVVGLRLYVERDNVAAQQTYLGLGMIAPGYFVLEKHPL